MHTDVFKMYSLILHKILYRRCVLKCVHFKSQYGNVRSYLTIPKS